MKTRFRALLSMLALALLCAAPVLAEGGQGRHGQRGFQRAVEKLELTADQQAKLKPVFDAHQQAMQTQRQAFQQQFRGILTPEQQAKLDQMKSERGERKGERGEWKKNDLNLTDAQKAQMKAVFDRQRPQMEAERKQFVAQVESQLNADQKTKFEQMMSREGRRHGKGQGGHRGGSCNKK